MPTIDLNMIKVNQRWLLNTNSGSKAIVEIQAVSEPRSILAIVVQVLEGNYWYNNKKEYYSFNSDVWSYELLIGQDSP